MHAKAIVAGAVLALALPFAAASAASQGVAPVYPGAQHIRDTGFSALYFTKDEASKVRGFYAGHGVKLSDAGALSPAPKALDALPPSDDSLGADLKDRQQICKAATAAHASAPQSMVDGPEAAGIAIGWRAPPKEIDQAPAKSSVFSGLRNEVNSGRHSQAAYDTLFKQYGWLETAYFPNHGEERYDRWLVNQTWAKLQAPEQQGVAGGEAAAGNMEALAKQMQALVAQGKMQQAQALATKMQGAQQAGMASAAPVGAAETKDNWNLWIGVLQKVAAHAYRTAIAVDKNPSAWPLLPYCPNLGK